MSARNANMCLEHLPYPYVLKNRRFDCGELIVKAAPFAHIISMTQNGKYCDYCANPPKGDKLRKCSACQYEHYCDQQCQKKAWKYHKFECPLLKARFPRIPADSVRLLTKILWKRGQGIERPPGDPGWRVWTDLCHHSHMLRTDTDRCKQFSEISSTVIQYVGFENMKRNGMFFAADMLPEFGRMVFNGYTLTHLCDEIGVGVYISPSVFNHSCVPNAAHVNIGTTLCIRTLREIDTSKEPICVNYIDPMQRLQTRQASLLKDYYFRCECKKCSDTSAEALLEATLCPGCGGDAVENDDIRKCLSCSKLLEDMDYLSLCAKTVVDLERLCEEALKEDRNIDKLENFVSTNHVLSKRNVILSMVKHALYGHWSQCGHHAKAYELGKELTSLFKLYYPQVYPTHGTHLLKQARLAWQLDDYENALNHYRHALKCLLITHGPEHALTKTVRSDLIECERDKFIFERN